MKSLFKAVALITIFSVLTRIAGFIFRIFLSRTIGAETIGLYQVAFSVFVVLLTVVSSGLPFIISRITAKYNINNNKRGQGELVSTALILAILVAIFLCIIVLCFKNLLSDLFTNRNCVEILIALLPALFFSSIYSVLRGVMWGNNNYFALCITELYEQIVRIFICVLLLGTTMSALDNALSVAWSLSIACVLSAFFVVLMYFYYGGKLEKPTKIYKKLIKESLPITGVRIAGSLLQPLIAIIIPFRLMHFGYTNAQALALYGVAVGMTFPLLFIPGMLIGSLSTALVPDISSAHTKGNNDYIQNRVITSIKFTLVISAFCIPIFIGVGDLIGVFLYDNVLSGNLLQMSAWVMLPMGVNNITSSLLNSLGMEVKSCVNYFFGAIALFLSLWFLPEFMGINAFAMGMGLSTTITSILNIIMLQKKLKVKINILSPLFKIFLIIIPASALTAFVVALLNYILPMFFVILIACIVASVCFILLSLVFNIVDIEFLNILKRKLKINKLSLKKNIKNNA